MRHETIADALLARVGDDHPGLLTRGASFSWDEVVRASAARAAVLATHEVSGPPHVGVLLDNVAEFVFWLGGAALRGASIVGINPTRGDDELAEEVGNTDCQLIVTDHAGLARLETLELGLARDRFLVVDSESYASEIAGVDDTPVRGRAVTAETQLLLLFTSGTTGASKAARCSQGRLARLAAANSAKYDITRADISYCCMPLFHGNALMALWGPSLVSGATIALAPKFSASGFLDDVRHFEATYFTYVGKAIGYLLATPERSDDADNQLTHAFGTEASPADQQEFRRRFGATLVEGYGSSESAGMVELVPDAPAAALGRPAHDGVAVVDPEALTKCPPAKLDEHGRVRNAEEAIGELVNFNGAAEFEGYYNNPVANAEKVRNGWYWTGDLGYVDESGYLYFAGRAGDWIRVDGENISALRIEHILLRHPEVRAAAVFGVADERSGDQVMAALEVAGETRFDDLGLAGFLAGQDDLGSKATPRFVRIAAQLPTTGSNKLRKNEMRVDAWRASDDVYWWRGRAPVSYAPMTAADKSALRERFEANGRLRFHP